MILRERERERERERGRERKSTPVIIHLFSWYSYGETGRQIVR